MTDVPSLMLVRELYEYHWWANRRLFEAAAALGEKATIREMGAQFSEPTVKALFVQVYGFDCRLACSLARISAKQTSARYRL